MVFNVSEGLLCVGLREGESFGEHAFPDENGTTYLQVFFLEVGLDAFTFAGNFFEDFEYEVVFCHDKCFLSGSDDCGGFQGMPPHIGGGAFPQEHVTMSGTGGPAAQGRAAPEATDSVVCRVAAGFPCTADRKRKSVFRQTGVVLNVLKNFIRP